MSTTTEITLIAHVLYRSQRLDFGDFAVHTDMDTYFEVASLHEVPLDEAMPGRREDGGFLTPSVLDRLFAALNDNPEPRDEILASGERPRSMSVGDVVLIGETAWFCDRTGWFADDLLPGQIVGRT